MVNITVVGETKINSHAKTYPPKRKKKKEN